MKRWCEIVSSAETFIYSSKIVRNLMSFECGCVVEGEGEGGFSPAKRYYGTLLGRRLKIRMRKLLSSVFRPLHSHFNSLRMKAMCCAAVRRRTIYRTAVIKCSNRPAIKQNSGHGNIRGYSCHNS